MLNTTLCYVTRGSQVLMLHRVKKKADINKDKWIGIGGKFEGEESPDECLLREAKEETGLTLEIYEGGDVCFRRPFFMAQGLTDESSTMVYGYASGEISSLWQEASEDIEVCFVDRKQARAILGSERVSVRAAYMLMQFLHAKDEEPFAFLN